MYKKLLTLSRNGKLKIDSTRIVSTTLGVNRRTVQRIWHDAKEQMAQGLDVDVSHKKAKAVGRKPLNIDWSEMTSIPYRKRTTIRSLANALKEKGIHLSPTTLHRKFKMGLIRRHSSTVKPFLKDENKMARLRFCLSMLDESTVNTAPKFLDMHSILHIDEKWFYMTKKKKSYYLVAEEDDPHRTVQNKNCIGKVMFLGVLGQPLRDGHGNELFSGKFGIFPFVIEVKLGVQVLLF